MFSAEGERVVHEGLAIRTRADCNVFPITSRNIANEVTRQAVCDGTEGCARIWGEALLHKLSAGG